MISLILEKTGQFFHVANHFNLSHPQPKRINSSFCSPVRFNIDIQVYLLAREDVDFSSHAVELGTSSSNKHISGNIYCTDIRKVSF